MIFIRIYPACDIKKQNYILLMYISCKAHYFIKKIYVQTYTQEILYIRIYTSWSLLFHRENKKNIRYFYLQYIRERIVCYRIEKLHVELLQINNNYYYQSGRIYFAITFFFFLFRIFCRSMLQLFFICIRFARCILQLTM